MVLISTKKNAERMMVLPLLLAILAHFSVLGESSEEMVSLSPAEETTEAEELDTSPTIVGFSDEKISLRSTIFLSTMVTDQKIPSTGPVSLDRASKPPAKPQVVANSLTTIKKIEEGTPTPSFLSTGQDLSTPLLTSPLPKHEPSTSAHHDILATSLPSVTNLMLRLATNDGGLTRVVDETSDSSTNSRSSSVLLSSPVQAKTNGSDLPVEAKDAPRNVTSTVSLSPSTHKTAVTIKTMAYSTNQGSHVSSQVSEAETHSTSIITAEPHLTTSDSRAGVGNTTSASTSKSAPSSAGIKNHWYIVIAVVALSLLLLALCFMWNVHRRRSTGSTSFETTNKKKRKGGEDAWAGPVHMPEDNAMPVDVVVDEPDPSGKRLTLTTFFNKRKSQQCSVVMKDVNVQSERPAKEEAAPLLSQSTNGQIKGGTSEPQGSVATPTAVQEPTPTTCVQAATVQLQANGQVVTVQETVLAPPVDSDALPPPPSPPPQTDFPPPPPASDAEGAGSMV
ncbi:hypothetical protein NDU88_003927 [Pleurodeles waltl]|uniref:Leukosialin n=1 Tax=Pleurodeles waltl TaxID=8319 RepID=A0AAV7PAZ3_PLEWA|nr:hypothetical protein NDU88_003927 [Pleurodeles waltl]